jgi:hypothetical protein
MDYQKRFRRRDKPTLRAHAHKATHLHPRSRSGSWIRARHHPKPLKLNMKKTNKSVKPANVIKVTKEEMAARLNGMDALDRVSTANRRDAANSNLIIMQVWNDGNEVVEFSGAAYGRRGTYKGLKVYFFGSTPIHPDFDKCSCKCCAYSERTAVSGSVDLLIGKGGYAWSFKTNMPHATFDVTDEGGAKYCRGIVFEVPSIPFKPAKS